MVTINVGDLVQDSRTLVMGMVLKVNTFMMPTMEEIIISEIYLLIKEAELSIILQKVMIQFIGILLLNGFGIKMDLCL
jgi:hypothetical protein